MTESQLSDLIRKYLSGVANDDDVKKIEEWYESFDDLGANIPIKEDELESSVRRSLKIIIQRIATERNEEVLPRRKKTRRVDVVYKYAAVAAVVILILGIAFLLMQQPESQSYSATNAMHGMEDIQPGGNKAILTLGNGKQIILDSTDNGLLSMQGNTKIIKINKGLLSYNSGPVAERQQSVQYNIITTPRGGKYEVVLSDGSKVWLNAASSIKFPTTFVSGKREVTIKGEAYFEIAENAERPFMVKKDDIEIKVLGTSFNVMAYDDEAGMQITLVEGAVRVTSQSGHGEDGVRLRPGQQVILNLSKRGKKGSPIVKEVNVAEAIAWKDNLFWFDNDDVQEVSKKLSRWYNMEITVDGNIPDRFTGSIPMDLTFSQVVGMLQKTGRIQYKIIDKGKIALSPLRK